MPAGLHRPDLIPLRAEGLFAVGLDADVDQQRAAVLVQRHAAGVVVVVAVGVVAGFQPGGVRARAHHAQPHAGVPGVGRGFGVRAAGIGADLALGKGGLHHVKQVDALAVVGGRDAVGVLVGGQVGGGQRHQRRTAHALAKQVFARAARTGQRAAVGKVQVVGAGHVHLGDVLGHVADLGLLPHGVKHAGGQRAQQFQRVIQRQRRVAVILRALAAGAVVAVVFQKAVDAVGRLLHGGADAPRAARVQQRRGDQAVLGAPGRPVAHRLVAVAHPPKMRAAPGAQHPPLDLARQAGVQAGVGGVQRVAQQVVQHGQQRAGLGRKQVHHRAGGVGQRQLRRVADITVVRRQLPGALLTDGPGQVGDGGQVLAGGAHALGHGQAAQKAAAGKVGVLIPGAVAGGGKIQPQMQRQRRELLGCARGLAAAVQPAVKAGQRVPRGAVAQRGAGDPAAGGKVRAGGQQFSQHRRFPPLWGRRPCRRRRAACAGSCAGSSPRSF